MSSGLPALNAVIPANAAIVATQFSNTVIPEKGVWWTHKRQPFIRNPAAGFGPR